MSRIARRFVTLGLCLLLGGLASAASAQEKQGTPNVTPPEKAKDVKAGKTAEQVETLTTAHQLIHFGRKHHSPEALIAAAKMMGTIPTQEREKAPKVELKDPSLKDTNPAKMMDNSPFALLTQAKEMAKGNKVVIASADKMKDELAAAPRGATKGPWKSIHTIPPYGTHRWVEGFRAGEWAVVTMDGDGGTDLDIYVHDDNGYLIVQDIGPSDYATVRFLPFRTSNFTITIRNLGGRNNIYYLINN